jgi:hypothetical protein
VESKRIFCGELDRRYKRPDEQLVQRVKLMPDRCHLGEQLVERIPLERGGGTDRGRWSNWRGLARKRS